MLEKEWLKLFWLRQRKCQSFIHTASSWIDLSRVKKKTSVKPYNRMECKFPEINLVVLEKSHWESGQHTSLIRA